jgi:hypothetical protein
VSEDFVRQYRVIDQMLSAHCQLRDGYERLALWQNVLALFLSVGLVATKFIDPVVVERLGVSYQTADLALGLVSVALFTTTVIDLRVRWKERGGAHRGAAKALAELKHAGQGVNPTSTDAEEWVQNAKQVLKGLPEIPEAQFLRLKARHVKKVELSKMISRRPGASLTALRLALWWTGNFPGRRRNEVK